MSETEKPKEFYEELHAMVRVYDGSIPFHEFVKQYEQDHPSRWDFSNISFHGTPINKPRRGKP